MDDRMIPLSVLREYMPKLKDEDLKELGPIEYDQSKVPEVSKKHAENVRRKAYLPDMTESFARGVEYAGLIANEAVDISNETKGRQDTVETQFNSVQQELTDKDPISAPEIIAARNGASTLYERLEREKQEVTAQLAQTTKVYNTVTDMILLHTTTQGDAATLGYHSINDGGGSLYTVLSHPEKSYDIEGNGMAFRPIVTGTIHPKMFGTKNDGISLDNEGLQACYDYAFDQGIERIDGLGLLYTVGSINPYDTPARGWAHTGAMCKSGRTLVNFRFKTAAGSTAGTVPLTIDMTDKPIVLENIEIDGNRSNLSDVQPGREDGGCHGIHFHHQGVVPDVDLVDFLKCGDIHMKNCKVKNVYSYGVRIDALDCYMLVENCDFDLYGIAVQAHTTRFEVRGGLVKIGEPRTGMVPDAFHEEIEFGDNYQGTKTQSILIKDVKAQFSGSQSLYKVHYQPMAGVAWDKIEIIDCDVNNGGHLSIYNGYTKKLFIDTLSVKNPRIKNPGSKFFIDIRSLTTGMVEIKELTIENKKDLEGFIKLSKTDIDNFLLQNVDFTNKSRIMSDSDNINNLKIIGTTTESLDGFGVMRTSPISKIVKLEIMNSNFTDTNTDDFYLFQADIKKLSVSNAIFKPNANDAHGRIFFSRSTDRFEFLGRDILLEGSKQHGITPFFVIAEATDGYVYMNNVRHLTTIEKPRVKADNIDPLKIKFVNCENLY